MLRILLFVLICPLIGWCQQPTKITVSGQASLIPKDMVYKANMTLSKNLGGSSRDDYEMSNLKDLYTSQLQKQGMALNKLEEFPLDYKLTYSHTEGTKYVFKTRSLEEFNTFLDISSVGLERGYVDIETKISTSEALQLKKAAIDHAHQQAELTAEALGKKLGDIVSIEEVTAIPINTTHILYFKLPLEGYTHHLSITYTLK
ncbi:SIMPL domain-containing protein [Sediminicola luteus]|uniref:SIMPL domain-containing protein n=1 Tax=Sediminicola luteus TaxID=319238 RepID=A0A2A4GFB7_9FLAO|nr:SIMPL domain-containing protein [Sediminicola luteus]PCE66432.1 hypothetical protein B7P33_03815 [Sediminicola luteus]